MNIGEFIDVSARLSSLPDLLTLYQKALSDIGYDKMMYSALKARAHSDELCLISTYDPSWLAHYVESGYTRLDPLRRYGPLQHTAFSWDSLARQHPFSPAEQTVMEDAKGAHLFHGAAVPLHGPHGELSGLAVASSQPHKEADFNLAQLNVLTIQFHIAYSSLSVQQEAARPGKPKLSKREREVLQWAARGKSNWVIGELLNISEHGVDYHFRNILRKLDADSRITAVVKALYFGWISL